MHREPRFLSGIGESLPSSSVCCAGFVLALGNSGELSCLLQCMMVAIRGLVTLSLVEIFPRWNCKVRNSTFLVLRTLSDSLTPTLPSIGEVVEVDTVSSSTLCG